ncbi:hypothetical protein GF380_02205 [Candidatus Uhrbacteria bacterium]|nr:hypothetical protein [Candidatus Uhrbacteria bacterium]MBD3284029.1 hypothetical protein [Candidatus Uhrbacteria bacterium]
MKKQRRRSNRNLFLHGVQPGLGFARLLRSPLQRFYHRRYKSRMRCARAMYAFDMGLLATILVLLGTVLSFLVHPPRVERMTASFHAPPFHSAAPVPLLIRVQSDPSRDHHHVRLQWNLPQSWEVLHADPPLQSDGSVLLGSIPAGNEAISKLTVRMYEPVGRDVRIGYSLRYAGQGLFSRLSAVGERRVTGSGLLSEIPEAFMTDSVVPAGAVLPIRIQNTTEQAIPFVEVRALESSPVTFDRILFGDLPAFEQTVAYLPIQGATERAEIHYGIYAASRLIQTGTWKADIQSWQQQVLPSVLVADPNADTSFRVWGGEGTAVAMILPSHDPSDRFILTPEVEKEIRIPATDQTVVAGERWMAAPIHTTSEGDRILGSATMGTYAAPVPFTAEAVYYSPAGDQLGIGPHPPRVGERTRYWIFWKVGPVLGSLTNIHVEATVPPRVRLTGNVTQSGSGDYGIQGNEIWWFTEEMGSASGFPERIFGFEVEIVPEAGEVGSVVRLLDTTSVRAIERPSGLLMSARKSAIFSEVFDPTTNTSTGAVLP